MVFPGHSLRVLFRSSSIGGDSVYSDIERASKSFSKSCIRAYMSAHRKRMCLLVHAPDGATACERAVLQREEDVADIKGVRE